MVRPCRLPWLRRAGYLSGMRGRADAPCVRRIAGGVHPVREAMQRKRTALAHGRAFATRARQGPPGALPHPRSRSLMLVLARVFASTCLTMTAQYSEWLPSAAGSEPDTTTLPGGT